MFVKGLSFIKASFTFRSAAVAGPTGSVKRVIIINVSEASPPMIGITINSFLAWD